MTTGPAPTLRLHLMRLEHLAVTTIALLQAAGVDTVLLKGPVTSTWLYGGPEARSYRDIDVLVRPAQTPAARRALRDAGYTDLHAAMLAVHRPTHERTWTKDGQLLDVHTRLAGVPAASAARAFDLLWAGREAFALQGASVNALSPAARAVHLTLHSAQSREDSRARRDLELGLAQLSEPLWREALALAERMGCAAAMTHGLRSVRGGVAVAHALGARTPPTVDVLLKARSASMEAQNLWEALSSHPRQVIPASLLRLLVSRPTEPVPTRTFVSAVGRSVIGVGEVLHAARLAQIRRSHPLGDGQPLPSGIKGAQPGNPDISDISEES